MQVPCLLECEPSQSVECLDDCSEEEMEAIEGFKVVSVHQSESCCHCCDGLASYLARLLSLQYKKPGYEARDSQIQSQ